VEEVSERLGRARSTVVGYLTRHIEDNRPESIARWVDDETYRRVASAAAEVGDGPLKPIYERLNQEIDYDRIRLVVTHRRAVGRPGREGVDAERRPPGHG